MKNYVLCTTLDNECLNTLQKIRHQVDLKHTMVHIVTVVKLNIYQIDLSPYIYPTEIQYANLELKAIEIMKKLGESLNIDSSQIIYQCFFEYNKKETIKTYLEKINADLVVVATRGKYGIPGLFSSSFADFLCKFSPCDILVMRPTK
ncbi:universal stress protein [Bacteriovorax sp. PP10]|uniref:Universal stress protein n=1 Tax=Bacteriovorax antarcticus TaxID=3088717 RepID=A0ABU5VUS3_9BACT|nr:universal stress protein [Bacteriovorax sp. PP10]MEA9355775.1 universal stress protein [Bacteriovorax sp. PP10]